MTKTTLADLRREAIGAHQADELPKAETLYREVLKFRPLDGGIWSNLGALYRKQKKYELAALSQRRALECEPVQNGTLNNAANALFDNGDIAESLELRLRLQELEPDQPNHWAFGAKCLRGLRRYAEAADMANAGLEMDPDHVELHLQLAFAKLSLGEYPTGFQEYDWRWQGDELTPPKFTQTKWQGEPIKGKTILAVPEQGFGDTIIMARFLRQLKDAGATVYTLCKGPLMRLFDGMDCVDKFNPTTQDLTDVDYWTPYMDMPMYLGTTIQTVPAPTVLNIPAESTARAKARIAPTINKFNVGVLWSGSVTYRANHKRSFDHHKFLGLADISGLQMFSLYKGPLLDTFLADGSSSFIQNAGGEDRDFADSAALIQELDLVITMDSAIAHVAASLGAPVWNLLHDNPYWLYEAYEDHTPWYPSMRMVRQSHAESWDDVFKRVRQDLIPLVNAKTGAT